jgi:hypothetical protein
MNYKESLDDTIRLGFYRKLINGRIRLTNGKKDYDLFEFAKLNQHFDTKGKKTFHTLDEEPNAEPWPEIESFIVDFNQPYGKIVGQPFFNVAPEMPIKSENNGADTSLIWAHIENLCGNVEQDVKEWVKDFVADIFQHPTKKPGTALTFRSAEGTGKGFLFDDLMRKLLGERHLSTSDNIFKNNFNAQAKNKILINLDEGSFDNSKSSIGDIKAFITQPTFQFEEKYREKEGLPNHARLVLTTNEDYVIKNDGSRRFCQLHPVKQDYYTEEYGNKLWATLDDESLLKQFLYELETRQITHNLRVCPKTDESLNQELITKGKFATWLDEVIEVEHVPVNGGEDELWLKFTPMEKICFPAIATAHFNEQTDSRVLSNNLFGHIKNCVERLDYKLTNPNNREYTEKNKAQQRIWKFEKIIYKKTAPAIVAVEAVTQTKEAV